MCIVVICPLGDARESKKGAAGSVHPDSMLRYNFEKQNKKKKMYIYIYLYMRGRLLKNYNIYKTQFYNI